MSDWENSVWCVCVNSFIKDCKCDLCGKPLTETNHIGVISIDEVLCLHCFREGAEHNYGEIVELNAKNYSLKYKYDSLKEESRLDRRRSYDTGFHDGKNQMGNVKLEYQNKVEELLDEFYVLALKTDSATTIQLFNELKERVKEL